MIWLFTRTAVLGAAITATLAFASPLRAEVAIQEVTSPGGLTAWLVEEPSIPFVALEIRFKGGTSLDPAGKRGAVNLMTGLIEEGAGDLDARSFAESREALAADFSFSAYDDAIAISARMLTENRDEAVALLRAALITPRFDQDAIDRVRQQVLSAIRSDAKDPNSIASSRFDALAFGDHPYGTNPDGTEASVTTLTRADIQAVHRGALTRDRLFIGASGDITAPELAQLMDDLLGDLPATGLPMPDAVTPRFDGGLDLVPYDTPQSVALFGHAGLPREDPDFFAAFVLNHIFGAGGFESRLMTEVREKRGLTYGISTYLVAKDHAALYLGQVASANDRMAEAIDVIRVEWRALAETGVTAQELHQAQTFLTGAYPLRFDGNDAIAGIMVGMQMDDLPIDYIKTRNDKVRAVTVDDITRTAQRLLDPDALTFVIVGQPEGL
ncbi:MAG: M16 family metallopeptidase [Primorskyibacter sp.]